MANPWAGEVELTLNGQPHTLKLTLGALAELEGAMEADSLVDLVRRFEEKRFSSRDVVALIVAGLRGGGWRGSAQYLVDVEIGGGPMEAARAAGQLLVRAFALPE
jgi:Phage tail tube protein, GTA-gp10